jgi:hypothetical protein
MAEVLAPSGSPAIPRDRVPGWAAWPLRILVLLIAVVVFLQPLLAGLYVMGNPGMRGVHLVIGHALLPFLVLLTLVAALAVWRPGRGPAWPIWMCVGLFFLFQIQSIVAAAATHARWLLAIHLPLGALIFAVMVVAVYLTWSPRIRVRRVKSSAKVAPAAGGDAG